MPALNGAWRYSARYAGEDGNVSANNAKLLEQLSNQKIGAPTFFVTWYFYKPKRPTPKIAFGRWHGEILRQPQGDGGFGYDPLFYVADQNATAAQMNPALKNEQSHRGKACQALLAQLQDQI